MESKNIKIIDEHGIDREASIVCSIDIDGSDYMFYWIERDSENNNIFVSKLIKNVDGSSNMINIDDENEKSKVSEIVKSLVKYSIENEDSKLATNSVKIGDKEYHIGKAIINKEQYINVPKTYITTVKKSVTKVCDDFYEINDTDDLGDNGLFKDFPVFPDVTNVQNTETVIPEIIAPEVVISESSAVSNVLPSEPTVVESAPVVSTVEEKSTEPASVVSEIPNLLTPEPTVAPVVEVMPAPTVVESAPVVSTVEGKSIESMSVVPEIPNLLTSEPTVASVVEATPVPTVVESAPVVSTVEEKSPIQNLENTIIFDVSKESNLNAALGEVSSETSIPVAEIDAVREFGQEESANVTPVPSNLVDVSKPATNGSQGFVNSKFFMIVAISFFVASCIFLGYEVFNYFQIVK